MKQLNYCQRFFTVWSQCAAYCKQDGSTARALPLSKHPFLCGRKCNSYGNLCKMPAREQKANGRGRHCDCSYVAFSYYGCCCCCRLTWSDNYNSYGKKLVMSNRCARGSRKDEKIAINSTK